MGNRKLSTEQEKEAIKLYLSSKRETLTSVGRKFGVSKGTIKRILIDNNVEITYDRSYNRVLDLDSKIEEIADMYINKKMSRNSIAKKFNTSHIVIKRLLARNGIIVENYSRENKETKLIDIAKNLKRNCTVEAEFFLELDSLENLDIEKIKVLNDRSKRIVYRNPKEYIDYKDFMRKFYNDKQFNLIYNTWKENKKNKWLSPSIDHKKPLSNGGGSKQLK